MDTLSAQHPFSLLASAVSGRPVYISYLKEGAESTYTDGEHIYLQETSDLRVRRYHILVQSLLIAGGSLVRHCLLALVGRPALCRRYLVLEVKRCARLFQERLPTHFVTAVDDCVFSEESTSPEQSLSIIKSAGQLPEPPQWYGSLRPIKILREGNSRGGQPLDSASLSELEHQLKRMEQALQEDSEEEARLKDSFWQWLSSPIGKDGMVSKLLRDLMDMSSSPDEDAKEGDTGGSMQSVSGRWVKRLSAAAVKVRSSAEQIFPQAERTQEAGSHCYQEWDTQRETYKPDWVTVEEVNAYSDMPSIGAGFSHGIDNNKIQRALAGLCFNYERHQRQSYGDDIVLDRLVDLATNVKAGHSGDSRIYQANFKTRRDLGVQILLDVSSSTLEMADEHKKVCDLQAGAAWQLCRAFSVLGDRVAMHGFHSWGRSLVRFQHLKSFNERMGRVIEQRIRQLSVAGYTRFGAAIRHGSGQLQRFSGTPFRLLLVISDGYPYDDQYEGHYAGEDTRKALEEARAQGVACVCLSVGSDADKAQLGKIYGDANYLAVNSLEKVAEQLRPVIEAALAGALKRGNTGS